jgi:molybdopterin/thiamine biosynthesis adenylyltransferase
LPGRTPCLECLCREAPAHWKRQFPVFGAVSGMAGCLGAMEVIKVLTGLGEPLLGRLLVCDLRSMSFRTLRLKRDLNCPLCGKIASVAVQ